MDTSRKVVVAVAVLIVAALVGWRGGKALARSHYHEQLNNADKLIDAVVVAINKRAPQMVDSDTRLDNAAGVAGTLIYYYTLPRVSYLQLAPSELRAEVQPVIRNRMCTSPESTFLLSKGVKVKMVYRDKFGKQFMELPIQAADCAGVL